MLQIEQIQIWITVHQTRSRLDCFLRQIVRFDIGFDIVWFGILQQDIKQFRAIALLMFLLCSLPGIPSLSQDVLDALLGNSDLVGRNCQREIRDGSTQQIN